MQSFYRQKYKRAFHDKVEQYIVRDISKIDVGDVLIADGHDLNFLVINPFTGKPTRAVLVGFLDWKSEALVNKPAWMKQGEKLHKNLHQKITGNYVPTIEETIIYLNCWLDFYNSKPCPNNRNMTI